MREATGGKKLDKWVSDNRAFDFQEKLSKKKRGTSNEAKAASYSASRSNQVTDNSFGMRLVIYLFVALIALKLIF